MNLSEKASVITVYDHTKNRTLPWRIKWRGRVYTVTQVGYHHTREHGNTLHHIFSVTAGSLYIRLNLDTRLLSWRIEEIIDSEQAK